MTSNLSGIFPKLTDDFGNWLAGFTDGEGCFLISHRKNNRFTCRFELALRSDDKSVLEEIRNVLDIGYLFYKPRHSRRSPNEHPIFRYVIQGSRELAKLVWLFEEFPLRAKKKRDFKIWQVAVRELNRYFRNRNLSLLKYCHDSLKEIREYNSDFEPCLREFDNNQQLLFDFVNVA